MPDLDRCSHSDQMVKLKAVALDREYEIRLWTRPGLDAYCWSRKACIPSESHGPAAEEGGSPEERRDAVSSKVEIKHVNCSWEGRGGRKRGRGERGRKGRGGSGGRPWETVSKDTWAPILG